MKLRDRMDPKYTRISLYVIGTCAIIYLLGYIIRNLPTVSGAIAVAFRWCWRTFTPVFWGFVLAYLLFPVNTGSAPSPSASPPSWWWPSWSP